MPDDLTPAQPTTFDGTPPFLPSERVRWGWLDVLFGIGTFMLSLVAGFAVAHLLHIKASSTDAVDIFSAVVATVGYGALVAVMVVAVRRKGLGSLAADFGLRFRPVDIAIGLGVGLGLKLFSVVLFVVVVTLTHHHPRTGNMQLSNSWLWIIVTGVVLATIVAPIVEELFCRGLVLRTTYNSVLRRHGTPARARRLAVLVSALGFALLHLYESPDPVVLIVLAGSTFALGFVNGLITLGTGRLGSAIIAHAFFNGSAVLVALLVRGS